MGDALTIASNISILPAHRPVHLAERVTGIDMDDRVGRVRESIYVLRPPFWGGANAGPEIPIKRAAHRVDGFTAPIIAPDQLAEDIDTYRTALEEAGKDRDEGEVTLMVDGYVAEAIPQFQ